MPIDRKFACEATHYKSEKLRTLFPSHIVNVLQYFDPNLLGNMNHLRLLLLQEVAIVDDFVIFKLDEVIMSLNLL